MRSKSIFKRAMVCLLIALFFVVATVVAIAIGESESYGHVSLICGSGLDRIEVVDKDGSTIWKLPQREIGWVEVNDADMLPNGNVVFACRAESSSTVYMIEPDYAKKSGYVRARVDGIIYDLAEEIKLEKNKTALIKIKRV